MSLTVHAGDGKTEILTPREITSDDVGLLVRAKDFNRVWDERCKLQEALEAVFDSALPLDGPDMTRPNMAVPYKAFEKVEKVLGLNKALASAAPDLYEALRKILRHIPDHGGCSLSDDLHRAKAALKKATGG